MSNNKALTDALDAIHRTFEEAEHQLSQLGGQLQFLISPIGQVEIVRRDQTGEADRPKVVIAELKGCDPMLWRGDCPAWLEVLAPRRDPLLVEPTSSDAEDGAMDESDPDPRDTNSASDDPPGESSDDPSDDSSGDTCQPGGETTILEA